MLLSENSHEGTLLFLKKAQQGKFAILVFFDQSENLAERLEQRGVYSRDDFYDALETYLSLTIEEALQSSNTLIRAWAMFDRRLGKRRLLSMGFKQTDHPFVERWYQLRCKAEGIAVGNKERDHEGA